MSPRLTLAAGLALIAVANAFVLAGVAYNRTGEPQATLRLSERELALPQEWGFSSEKSGITLNLVWRMPVAEEQAKQRSYYAYDFGGGETPWLTAAKLAELGFRLPTSADGTGAERAERYERERELFLVLEHDGPAYQRALQRVHEYVSDKETALSRAPGERRAVDELHAARLRLEHELSASSRLFVVDAGLDPEALRARYPERARHAVVAGRVRLSVTVSGEKLRVGGHVNALSVRSVNVPYELREIFAALEPTKLYAREAHPPRYEVTLAYGRRLEPWVAAAGRLAPHR